ncbi:hypothetical protein [Rosistilla oblonga]|uniref:hypothetical protein n=1 Tax=Rosistilla oblonga TaxID=2527990 RepID=UPI003A981A20
MMIQNTDPSVADRAKKIYEDRLKSVLEKRALDRFVAIEPDSGEYFLGATLSEAIGKARKKFPDRLSHAIRVGHKAAVHFGVHVR